MDRLLGFELCDESAANAQEVHFGDHSDELFALDDGETAHLFFAHNFHGLGNRGRRMDRDRIADHDVFDGGLVGLGKATLAYVVPKQ